MLNALDSHYQQITRTPEYISIMYSIAFYVDKYKMHELVSMANIV